MRGDTVHQINGLTTSKVRQASPRRMNLRALVVSMAILALIGLGLTTAYWSNSPEKLDDAPPISAADSATPATDQETPGSPAAQGTEGATSP